MNRKQVHRGILRRLLSLRHNQYIQNIRLVARLDDPTLIGGSSVRPVFVFIPDLHLMSRAHRGRYRFNFRKLKPKEYVKREVLFDQFCQAMLDFRNDLPDSRMLKVVQLGDFVDLWRELEMKDEPVSTTVGRILGDNPEAERHLVRTTVDSLRADLVRGNHDWEMSASTQLRRSRPAHVYAVDGKKTILATHGHVFDWVEDFSDELQEAIVEKFGPHAPPGKRELDRTLARKEDFFIDEEETFWGIADDESTGPQGAKPRVLNREEESDTLPPQVNVWVTKGTFNFEKIVQGHRLLPRALTYAREIRKGTSRYVKKLMLSGGLPQLRTIVIGHSHHARICIHHERGAPGKRLVLADCGAWIEYARFGKTVVPSCQIGVLCGGDMRIYQLDPHRRLYH